MAMLGSKTIGLTIGAMLLGTTSIANASETITYTYDAKGRLITVVRSGSVNNGVTANYTHDKADNRRRVLVTGAPR